MLGKLQLKKYARSFIVLDRFKPFHFELFANLFILFLLLLLKDSRYFDIDWVENYRRWPPALVEQLKLYKESAALKEMQEAM